ncbi:MAG: MurR/RpiR family transcriptional regulator [Alphaproteobacteria bacterium]
MPGAAGDRVPTLAEQITATLPSLTNAERRAARTLLARYPTAGIETATLFAERAGVSAPTILRFIAKLGFDGYAEFRSTLREELEARAQYPLTRPHEIGSRAVGLAALGERLAATVADTLAMCERSEFDRLVAALCDERRHVYLLGGDFTEVAARHLEFHLRKMRPRVRLLDHDLIRRADVLADLRRRDLLIAFDIRRYQPDTVATARLAAQRGATVVLMTDQWMSDAAEVAELVFRARVDGPSRWDSLVGMIAFVEVLVQAYDEEVWSRSEQRVKSIEEYRAHLDGAVAPDRAATGKGPVK